MEQQNQNNFPTSIFIHVGDALFDFMEPYKPDGKYDTYDYLFMKRVLAALMPALQSSTHYNFNINQAVGLFNHPSLIYSDDTYNPARAMDKGYKLAHSVYSALVLNRAYEKNIFPYVFHDLSPDLTAVFRFSPAIAAYIPKN